MGIRLFLILSVVFSFLQGIFLPLVFAEGPLVVFYLITTSSKTAVPLLISGLIVDLFQKQTLGLTSLIFLGFLALRMLTKEKVQPNTSLLLAGLAVGINMLRAKLVLGYIEISSLLFVFVLSCLLFKIVWRPEALGKIRL